MRLLTIKDEICLSMDRNAVVSNDEAHRYWLHQRVKGGVGWTVFCMLNPSLANKLTADPTSRRTIDLATSWDREGVILVNLYSFISPHPDDLYECESPVGAYSEQFIDAACDVVKREGGEFVCAWGTHPCAMLRAPTIIKQIRDHGVTPFCIKTNKNGSPKHPLYASGDSRPEIYHG